MKSNDEEKILVLRKDVYQSNPLIQARKDFDIIGMRVFLLGLQGLNPHFSENDRYFDVDLKEIFIPTSKVTELFGGNTKYLSDLKKACRKLFDAIVELNYADGGFKLMHMFDELEYRPKEGLYLQFSRKMRPYILDLFESRGYTRINVEYLFSLSSPYAVRLLELLLQYQNIKQFRELMEIKRVLTVEELRFALNVPEGAYNDRMNNFRRYVLEDPIKEINTRTPYIVQYETIKEGRKVVSFEFTMHTHKVPKEDVLNQKALFSDDAIKVLCSLGFTEKVAKEIFKKCFNAQDCYLRVSRAQSLLNHKKDSVKNRLGFLRKAIEEDWQANGSPARSSNVTSESTSERQPVEPTRRPRCNTKNLRVGKKTIPYSIVNTYIDAIRKGEHLEIVKNGLRDYNTTIEKFTGLCEKHGI